MPTPRIPERTFTHEHEAEARTRVPHGVRVLLAALLWMTLGGLLYATGLREPVRPLLLWGGALPLSWGMMRGVVALWLLVNAARRGN